MKFTSITKLFLIAIIAIQFVSCENKEYNSDFEDSPTQRLDARKKELSDLLTSSEFGWKAIYFTDNTQLGGFTHLFKFTDLKNVDMASDFDSDISVSKSEYEIQLGSTISLVFTTKNRIHLLSDSNSYPNENLRGKGYLGDFQFLYYGQENGEIIFRTNRSFQELRFVKATAQDWNDLSKNLIMKDNLNSHIFRTLETNNAGTIEIFEFNFDDPSRFATTTSIATGEPGKYNLGIGYTPTGIKVSPAVVVADQELTDFTYDATSGNFIAMGTNNVSAAIKYSNKPFIITDDYKLLLRGKPTTAFAYLDDFLASAPTNSLLFKSIIAQVNENLPREEQLKDIQLTFNDSGLNYIAYTLANDVTIFHIISTSQNAINKTIIFKSTAWFDGNETIAAPEFLKVLDDQFMNPEGFYVKKGNFNIIYSNDIYTFTSASTSFRITTYSL